MTKDVRARCNERFLDELFDDMLKNLKLSLSYLCP